MPPAALRLDRDSLPLLIGEAGRLDASAWTGDVAGDPGIVNWSTRDRRVATVDRGGTVTATGLGSTWIMAGGASGLDSARVSVTVRFTSVHAGTESTCGTSTSGLLLCWGWNDWGAFGDGGFVGSRVPVIAAGGRTFAAIHTAGGVTCGFQGIALWCWGYNRNGQVGVDERHTGAITAPQRVAPELDFAAVWLGAGPTPCARTADDAIWCWGWNIFDQLRNGVRASGNRPVPLPLPLSLREVHSGGGHMCGLDAAGAAWCWGRGELGQLGGGQAVSETSTLVAVSGGPFRRLVTGEAHTCGTTAAGEAWCWGANDRRQLGSATGTWSAVPVASAPGLSFDTLLATRQHACGLSGGVAWCWGENGDGQLGGDGSGTGPIEVRGHRFSQLSVGAWHTCGLDTDGVAWCWGRNTYGALGNGAYASAGVPVRVAGQR